MTDDAHSSSPATSPTTSPASSPASPAGPDTSDTSDTVKVLAAVEAFVTGQELEWERGAREGEVVVTLPGEHKLKTVLSLLVRERGLSGSAFVIRNADEAHERFYRTLLRRNLRMAGVAYAIDASGDVYVTSHVPLAGVDEAYLDQLLGTVLEAADEPFDELLEIGFITSMRKEWAWRISRGESTRNLDAFRHILDTGPQGEAPGEGSVHEG
ncbi:YbjN domain-containing protein [Arsenicicoccus bolidensis]|uniref:YbjN domain-containing protein n=1 Tax=Arsenicicoccus bolidensis TaxID=229480 RepID=UPI0002FC65F5